MRHDYNVTGHDYTTVKQHDYNVKRHDYTVKRHNDKRNDYKYSKYHRSKANDRSKLHMIKWRMKKIIPKSRIDRN